jgi:hypothetical protein
MKDRDIQSKPEPEWSSTTWEGSRIAQLRDWAKMSLFQKLKFAEELEASGMAMIDRRKARGLPYIDPDTGELVRGKAKTMTSLSVAESAPEYPAKRCSRNSKTS